MAFGWPRPGGEPMVFDMASASMARGEVMVAAREGHAVPAGTGLDRDGQPTTDAQAIIDGGMLLPFGGYKGAGIAMMIGMAAPRAAANFFWPSTRRASAARIGRPIAKAFSPNSWPSREPACPVTADAPIAPKTSVRASPFQAPSTKKFAPLEDARVSSPRGRPRRGFQFGARRC